MMDRYLFENLGPEKFQHLCQALLIKEHPNLQCFPVAQQDGGRDGLIRGSSAGSVPTVVVQVKYKRRDEGESADWMIKALELEKPKVERLAHKGAQRYIMMTNARPTAHEESGRIDKVQAWMDANLPIPAICLWRDDLDRRIEESESQLKLAYPAILTGEDTLTLIVAAQIGRDRERISRTLKSFVREQYRKDAEVKFRQTELANSLLTLFVDVPVDISPLFGEEPGRRFPAATLRSVRRLSSKRDFENVALPAFPVQTDSATANAADFLLDSEVQVGLPWVVLEGAPGQGKSTLAQYICQVHRAQYLGETEFLSQLAPRHGQSSFRLPVKVDLRDFAAFLDGRPIRGQEEPHGGPKTLERFLAALVSIQSGGLEFSADDLVETATHVPILLFLDGLDEVADLKLRRTLIDRISEGLNRLKENEASIQAVVTSRPSLFGTSSQLPKTFTRLSLAPISAETITEYAAKWTIAKNLSEEHAAEVKMILHDKLALAHIRELTRNPMQLAILLSLIDSVGYSLPDVRTDLYREYMKLFMTREAEKSAGVKQHRHLLLEIVEYLAWRLQCEAESNGSTGAISHDELRGIVAERLQANQQDTAILDDLFSGGIERVYVLVQRIEGQYEFEVQPLREYFAAKYLYSSAPGSHFRNRVVHGDRAHRFEAIAVNPYWANVTRFYAGFYEPGEIGALSSSLRELAKSKDLSVSVNARSIGAALLADWIFRSKKFIQDEVIDLVFDNLGVKLASSSALPGFVGASLDAECGRQHFAEVIFNNHITRSGAGVTDDLCKLLSENGGEGLSSKFQSWINEVNGPERTRRFTIACKSGGFACARGTGIDAFVISDEPSPSELRLRAQAVVQYAPNLLSESASLAEAATNSLLEWGGYDSNRQTNDIALLAGILTGPFQRRRPIRNSSSNPKTQLADYPGKQSVQSVLQSLTELRPSGGADDKEGVYSRLRNQFSILHEAFGDEWAIYRKAVLMAGAVNISEKAGDIAVTNANTPLIDKAFAGRAWRGRTSWWEERFSATEGAERLFWIALLLAWSPSRTISKLLPTLNDQITRLLQEDRERLLEVVAAAHQIYEIRGLRGRNPIKTLSGSESELAHVLFAAFGDVQRPYTPEQTDIDKLNKMLKDHDLVKKAQGFPGWNSLTPRKINDWLSFFSEAWRAHSLELVDVLFRYRYGGERMNLKVAEKVLRSCEDYSSELVADAYLALRSDYKPVPLQQVAAEGEWTYD